MIRALLSNFHMYAYIGLCALIAMLFVHNQSLRIDVKDLKFQLNQYEHQIERLELESKMFEDSVNFAELKANTQIQKDIIEANKILSLNVSSDCDTAITWAQEQAVKI